MTKLPDKNLLDGTKKPETTTGEFRLAMGNIRQFLFELFGDESSDKETARQTLGIDIDQLKEGIASKADKQTVEMALEEKADKKDLSLVATTGDYNHLVNKPEKSDTLEGYGIIADTTPTTGSTRPVTSDGIQKYVDSKVEGKIIPRGIQVFTQSGAFVIPKGVTSIKVRLCGGGGSGVTHDIPVEGGTSSFGTLLSATGGYANNVSNNIYGSSNGSGTGGQFNCHVGIQPLYGFGNPPFTTDGRPGYGGYAEGTYDVTPGESYAVTVGGGATGWYVGTAYPSQPGLVIVEW